MENRCGGAEERLARKGGGHKTVQRQQAGFRSICASVASRRGLRDISSTESPIRTCVSPALPIIAFPSITGVARRPADPSFLPRRSRSVPVNSKRRSIVQRRSNETSRHGGQETIHEERNQE